VAKPQIPAAGVALSAGSRPETEPATEARGAVGGGVRRTVDVVVAPSVADVEDDDEV